MTTVLKCGEYRCQNRTKNVNQFLDDRDWQEKRDSKSQPKATLRNLRCSVHAGAAKRSKYRNSDILPLTEADVKRLLKEQAKVDADERAEVARQMAERDQREAVNHAAEWASLDKPVHGRIEENKDRSLTAREEPVFEGEVWLEGEEPSFRGDARWFTIEPSHRYYGPVEPGTRLYPYIIRVVRGSNLNPAEARQLATLLNEAADKADEFNATRKPKA